MAQRRIEVQLCPYVLRWARERSGLDSSVLARKVGVKERRLQDWEETGKISMSQVERLARHTHTPLGFLFLSEPPEDQLPIPDFRTVGDRSVHRPSPDLLETVYHMELRQAWMRDELIELGADPLAYVGSSRLDEAVTDVARSMRDALGLAGGWASAERNWKAALRRLRDAIEQAGILLVFNGVVGNNTRRKLDPEEFRGFALIDEYAPLIFVNGADFLSAQMFTLAHELAHIWLGKAGVSNFEALEPSPHVVELFCNKVAAEFLVPSRELETVWEKVSRDDDPYQSIAKHFKVSTIVAARRALDLDIIGRNAFFDFYRAWREDERRKSNSGRGGGSFWNNQNVRIGKRFGTAIVRAVKEGRLLYRDAYSLTGLRGRTFDKLTEQLGVEL